jgi:uncharacterized protein with HEPN domain
MHESVAENLNAIIESCQKIMSRFHGISSPADFIRDEDAQTRLDAIAMRLQIIGENVKSIAKIDPSFLTDHPDINWRGIMRLRDIISHHYDAIDHEIVFNVCNERVPELLAYIERLK